MIKKIATTFLLFALPFLLLAQEEKAQGIQFFSGSFEEAKELAKAEGKLIFIDAFAVWCGPCKRMANTVFTQEEVGKVFNTYFINMKIDMEKPMGQAFGKKYPVTAYPTLFFLDAEGTIMEKVVGGRSVEDFIALGQKFTSKATLGGVNYAKLYEEGQRSAEIVYHYVLHLNKTGKNSLSIVNEFLKGKTQFSEEWELRLLFEGAQELDSKVFDLFLANRKALIAYYSEEEIMQKALSAARVTVAKAAEFEYSALMEQAKEKIKQNFPKQAKSFSVEAELLFAAENKDEQSFSKHINDVDKTMSDRPEALYRMASLTDKYFPQNKSFREKAIQWLDKAKVKDQDYRRYFFLAQLHYKNGQTDKARENAEKALELAEINKENSFPIKSFLAKLNG